MSSEQMLGYQWINSTLSGDSTLMNLAPGEVWRALAPPGTAMPYIIVTFQSGTDEIAFGAVRPYTSMFYEVKAVGLANSGQAITNAASRIDTLLPTTQISITGGTLLGCYRTQPLALDELIDGELWLSAGGMYRLMIKAS